MIWFLGYLIGIVLCVIVLSFTTFNCDDDETVWLVSIMWPLILIGYFLLLVCAILERLIDKYYYIKNRIKKR